MAQKYRIYINQNVLLIAECALRGTESYKTIDHQSFDFKKFFAETSGKKKAARYLMVCEDAKQMLKAIIKQVTLIEAAGGLVKYNSNEFLFIYRNDKWDLPKGKLEKGEKPRDGAVREVEEECGIQISKCGKRICKTYHAYTIKGEVVLKRTYWYNMRYKGKGELKPQVEEGITDVRWFKKSNINKAIISNTFPSIMDVLVKKELTEAQ